MSRDQKRNAIIINGKQYDRDTGLLIGSIADDQIHASKQRLRQRAVASANVHSHLQRSQTLRRQSVAPPQKTAKYQPVKSRQPAKSPMIRRFSDITPPKNYRGPQTAATTQAKPAAHPDVVDKPFETHPLAARVSQRQQFEARSKQAAPTNSLSSQPASAIKQAVINEAMEASASQSAKESRRQRPKRTKAQPKHRLKSFSFASASLAIVLLGGYFSYLAMPNLSVRVAAVQSGVDASYPSYRPNGYQLNGPVAYKNGQVSMNFKANGGPIAYSLTQSNSNWDSTAVEVNYVQPDVDDDYSVTKKSGLTIYTYGNGKAAWVNKGILYLIEGNAPLSSDQIARIATSM